LKAGGVESVLAELSSNTESRVKQLKARTEAHRPAGIVDARENLQESLAATHSEFWPARKERYRRAWVARMMKANGIPFPNEKKNRKRFERRPHSPIGNTSELDSIPMPEESDEARARAERLKDVPL
jgi:hypothetical protein